MILTELWKTKNTPTISFEFFPPRNEKAEKRLKKVFEKLSLFNPDFISVTFGAGGRTKEGSFELVKMLKQEKGMTVLPYFACFGLDPEELDEILINYKNLGIENLLAVRGDIPRNQENFIPHPESFQHASEFLEFINSKYNFCLGAAGYPQGHIEAESFEKDIEYIKLKVDRGAKFIIANYFWDNKYFLNFRDKCEKLSISVPIIPGIMPIFSIKTMEMLATLSGATIPDKLRSGINSLSEDDKESLIKYGIEFATDQCKELIKQGIPGLHFYTMDKSKSTIGILNNLKEDNLI